MKTHLIITIILLTSYCSHAQGRLWAKAVHILLLLSIAFYHKGYAQPYKSMFGSQFSEWHVLVGNFENPEWKYEVSKYEKDTQVNSVTYKKISYGKAGSGLFREVLDSGKVWYIPPCESKEHLYMDYSLKKGDIFDFNIYNGTIQQKTVDSVFYVDGRKYIRCLYTRAGEQIIFIEGIGCIWGIASHYNNYCASPLWEQKIRCVYQDGALLYSGANESCNPFTTSIAGNVHDTKFTITPNPASSILRISNVKGITAIKLTDIQGRTIRSYTKPIENIDVSMLASGMYLLQLQTSEGVYTHKFVKE